MSNQEPQPQMPEAEVATGETNAQKAEYVPTQAERDRVAASLSHAGYDDAEADWLSHASQGAPVNVSEKPLSDHDLTQATKEVPKIPGPKVGDHL